MKEKILLIRMLNFFKNYIYGLPRKNVVRIALAERFCRSDLLYTFLKKRNNPQSNIKLS